MSALVIMLALVVAPLLAMAICGRSHCRGAHEIDHETLRTLSDDDRP